MEPITGIIGAHGMMNSNKMIIIPNNIELITMGSKGSSIYWGNATLTKKLTIY